MKRTTTVLALAALLVALTAGAALAVAITCPTGAKGLCEGSVQDDLITGTDGKDRIGALDGRDEVLGGPGNDTINGGKGADGLDVPNADGDANPQLHGDEGDDVVSGGDSADDIEGDVGNDRLSGDDGNDEEIDGDAGDDVIRGGYGKDGTDAAGGGNLRAEGGKNEVFGGPGADQFDASTTEADGGDVEKIFGGLANDTIIANDGVKDIVDCGRGEEDQVLLDEGLDVVKDCEFRFPADEAAAERLMAQPGDDDPEEQQPVSSQAA